MYVYIYKYYCTYVSINAIEHMYIHTLHSYLKYLCMCVCMYCMGYDGTVYICKYVCIYVYVSMYAYAYMYM